MYICFVEYRIDSEFESEYRSWISARQAEGPSFRLYEGTDQPLLFVEIWETEDESTADAIKKERCSERSSWHAMADWVQGGAPKIHSWTFRPVNGCS
ncbi:hypothetical protein PAECIP111893_03419 [Paenibacillus plantiphilus]|uniref:Antibiotic biosynthesis monooxygenase n=1 Tax=Paenibacillus plantiphilus TaxID=2905650 RepID=A0ABN8GN41_9BACL|nr:hypothetical protein [Paenibacillus plantiphilus]CAH1211516.1 hypothetical protein PAECIP111893_03419 [Paenibacillus plantiphilus]